MHFIFISIRFICIQFNISSGLHSIHSLRRSIQFNISSDLHSILCGFVKRLLICQLSCLRPCAMEHAHGEYCLSYKNLSQVMVCARMYAIAVVTLCIAAMKYSLWSCHINWTAWSSITDIIGFSSDPFLIHCVLSLTSIDRKVFFSHYVDISPKRFGSQSRYHLGAVLSCHG